MLGLATRYCVKRLLSATMLHRIHIDLCSKAVSAVLENGAGFMKLDIYHGHGQLWYANNASAGGTLTSLRR